MHLPRAAAIAMVGVLAACGDNTSSGGGGQGGNTAGGGNTPSGGNASNGGNGTAGGVAQVCNPDCTAGLMCCHGLCINPGNDIHNCGGCDNPCDGLSPFCDNGTCGDPPCDAGTVCPGTGTCCASSCCAVGQLCCVVSGGDVGPPSCVEPNENGTCEPGCPACVCASPDTPILTPAGERPIAELAQGDLVYSVDGGEVRAVPIAAVNRVRVHDHRVMRVVLESGRVLEISARHPTSDGGTFGNLRAGDSLQGERIRSVEGIAYRHEYTYDILPDSDTGTYFAAGALIGSTLGGDLERVPKESFAAAQ